MNKITKTAIVAMLAISVSGTAFARHGGSDIRYARVISATPIYEAVQVNEPVRECWNEEVVHRHRGHSPAGTVVGGILGGVIGNQFGRGDGKTAATVAGTLVGASVGRHVSREHDERRRRVSYERHCEWVDNYETAERLIGYRVKYRYQGEIYTTRTEEHPGERIPIEISVRPVSSY